MAPVPRSIARLMLSTGIEFSRAFSTATLSRGFIETSPPPARAATIISRLSLVKIFPRIASCLPLRMRMFFHFEWPAMLSKHFDMALAPNLRRGGPLVRESRRGLDQIGLTMVVGGMEPK